METLQRAVLALLTFTIFCCATASAMACTFSRIQLSPEEKTNSALQYFDESAAVYEGIFLGSHNYETGGNLLVLRSYKGPASPFTIVHIDGGNSCYSGVPIFASGFVALPEKGIGFDDFVPDSTLKVWRGAGLVDSGMQSPSNYARALLFIVMLTSLAAIIFGFRRIRRA